jgi:hypothetical protein
MKLAKKGNSEIVGLAFDFKSNRLASFSHSGDLSKPGQIRDQITLRIWNLDDGSLQTETRTILDQCCPVN